MLSLFLYFCVIFDVVIDSKGVVGNGELVLMFCLGVVFGFGSDFFVFLL